jgi:hypothetical protein
MLHRTNNIVKVLALLLFVFELVVSSFPIGVIGISEDHGTTLSHSNKLQNLFSPIFLEELSENEEEKNGNKVIPPANSQTPFEMYPISFDLHGVGSSVHSHPLSNFKTSPALFQMHCRLLI